MKKNYFINILTTKTTKLISTILLLATVFFSNTANAQVVVTVTNPTNTTPNLSASYTSLALAVTALNGVTAFSGPVILTCAAGTETAPVGGYNLTLGAANITTAANNLSINGGGATITAFSPQTTHSIADGILKVIGVDYLTIQNFTMQENALNTTIPTTTVVGTNGNNMTEFGIALFYRTATDGCQNVTIKNNTISLKKTNVNSFGIYSNTTSTAATPGTTNTATGATGANHNLTIIKNTISDVNVGMSIVGPTGVADMQQGLVIGGGTDNTNANTISNFGTGSLNMLGFSNSSATANGILLKYVVGYTVSYNNITSSTVVPTAAGAISGINVMGYTAAPTNGATTNVISNNSIAIKSAAPAGAIFGINIGLLTGNANTTMKVENNDFHDFGHTVSPATGAIAFIFNQTIFGATGTPNTGGLSVSGNTFTGISVTTNGIVYLIYNNSITPNFTVYANKIITSFTRSGTSATYCYFNANATLAGTATITNNEFTNITLSGGATIFNGIRQMPSTNPSQQKLDIGNNIVSLSSSSTAATGVEYGIELNGGIVGSKVYGNTVSGLSSSGAIVEGIILGSAVAGSGTLDCYNNTVFNLSGSAPVNLFGIEYRTGTGTANFYKNKIYNLSSSNITTGNVHGLYISAGTTNNIYNNIIGDLTNTAYANSTAPSMGINGIYLNAATNNIYNNTVYIGAAATSSSTTGFSSSCVFSSSFVTSVLMQNNLLVNKSTPQGAGKAVAFYRAVAALTSYATASNNNSLYGTSGLYWDGTTAQTTLSGYKGIVGMSPRETAALNINPVFLSTAGSATDYLHIDNTLATPLESGGFATGSPYNSDFDNDVRPSANPAMTTNGGGTSYDVGADEFDGKLATPDITYSSHTASNCTANTAHSVAVNVALFNDLSTAPTITYYFNGISQGTFPMTGGSLTAPPTTSVWSYTIPAAPSDAVLVTWSVFATDGTLNKTWNATAYSYRDRASSAINTTATSSVTQICPGGNMTLTATFASTLPAPAYGSSPSATATEEDISNVTLTNTATNAVILNNNSTINSLAATGTLGAVTATGLAGIYADYTAFCGTGIPVTQNVNYTFSVSSVLNTAVFTNAMAIFIDYNKNGVFTDAGEQVYVSAGVTAGAHPESFNFTIPLTSTAGPTRMRVVVKDTGSPITISPTTLGAFGEYEDYLLNIIPVYSNASVSWNRGATNLGTGNPLVLTGTAVAGTYTATATDAYGCTTTGNVVVGSPTALSGNTISTTSTALCNGTVATLSSAAANGCPALTYLWTSTGSGYTFSPSATAASPTFTSTISGSYNITCTVTDNNGTGTALPSSNTLTITVNNPQATVTGTPYTRCGTGTVTLNATPSVGANILNWYPNNLVGTPSAGTGTAFTTPTISASTTYYVEEGVGGPATGVTGTGTTTNGTIIITPFSGNWESQHTQYLVTAADLTAAGLTSGNLTALSFNVSTKGSSHSTGYVDYTMKIGSAGTTTALTGLLTPAFTTVYGPTTINTVLGANNFPFTTNYNWNGTDNIIVDVCFANDLTGTTTTPVSWSANDTVTGTTKLNNVTFGYRADNVSLCGTTSATSGLSTFLPNMTISGQSITCRGAKQAVPITVSAPNALTITANQTVCNGEIGTMCVTTPLANFTTYTWSPVTNLFTDAACTTAYTVGASAACVYVKSTTASTTAYTCTGTLGACVNTATSTVVIMPVPVLSSTSLSYCISGSPTLSLSPATGYTGGTIEWYSSTNGSTYTLISGATGTSYAPGTLTSTMYYEVILKNSAGTDCTAIAPVMISVVTPTISAPVAGSRCGTGTVTLGATGSPGTAVNWYTASTGGASIGTGASFVTPSIAATTTYYAAAENNQTYSNLGNTSIPTSTGASNVRGIVFTANQSGTIVSAQYYSPTLNVTNNLTVTLTNNATGTVLNTLPLSIVQGATAGFYTMTLNFPVTAGTTYRLLTSFSQSVNRISTGADYTTAAFNNLAPLGVIIGGWGDALVLSSSEYNYFHNIVVTTSCSSSPRTAIVATVNAPPAFAISSSTASICAGEVTTPKVTITTGAASYDTYTWSPAANSGNAATGWDFNPSATTTYTLTASQSAGSCATTATYTVTVLPTPGIVVVTPTAVALCAGKVQAITASAASSRIVTEGFNAVSTQFNLVQTAGTFTSNLSSTYFAEGTNAVLLNTGSNSANGSLELASNVNLNGYSSATVSFKHIAAMEAGTTATTHYDTGLIEYSTNGGTSWTTFPTSAYAGTGTLVVPAAANVASGTVGVIFDKTSYSDWNTQFTSATSTPGTAPVTALWKSEIINIPTTALTSSQFRIRFKYTTDGSTTYYGWLIDDVKISGNSNVTWSPITNLFIDNTATPVAYNPVVHTNQLTVYAKPTATTTYTATATSGTCTKTATCTITTGSTIWDGTTWLSGAPATGKNIEFQGNYTGPAVSGCNCTVTSGNVVITTGTMDLENEVTVSTGASLTFENATSLKQKNSSTDLINPIAPNTGDITYKRTTSPIVNNYDFVYWGSPVASQTLSNIWMTAVAGTFYTFNTMATTGLYGGEDWVPASGPSSMVPGVGYIAMAQNGVGFTAAPGQTWTASFVGVPNNGNVSVPIYKNGTDSNGTPNIDNLIANPYPSAINIRAFQGSENDNTGFLDITNAGHLTTNYYFWSHFTPMAYISTTQYWYHSGDYAIFQGTLGAGVGVAPTTNPGTFVPDKYFEAGQSFFAEASSAALPNGTPITFKNAYRVAGDNTNFYKNSNQANATTGIYSDKIWLNIDSYHGAFKQQLIAYTGTATNDFDEFLDAKSLDGNSYIDFYSIIPTKKLAIQSRPTFTDSDIVPLGYKSAVAGDFEISIDHSDGVFATGQQVYLQDNLLGIDFNLTTASYNFTTAAGTFDNRFLLKYTTTLGTDNEDYLNNSVAIANDKNVIKIKSSIENISKVTIFDMVGRKIYEKDAINNKNFIESNLLLATQTLIVNIKLENGAVISKKVINK